MATATENKRAGEFLVYDEGELSREKITVLSGQNLVAGAVVGRVKLGAGRAAQSFSGTGNGTLTGVVAGPDIQKGNYVIKCKTTAANGGVFSVTAPDGTALPDATVGTAYVSSHLSFTLNDGSSDFVLNDAFTLAVTTTAPAVSGTGNGTIGTITPKAGVKTGRYRATCTATGTNAGTFELQAPDGAIIDRQTITGGAGGTCTFSNNPQLSAVITDGGTDFAAGDTFDIVVFNELSGGKVVEWDPRPSSYDGRHIVAGILWDNVDASAADVTGVILARGNAQVVASELTWKSTVAVAEQAAGKAGLLALGIVAR